MNLPIFFGETKMLILLAFLKHFDMKKMQLPLMSFYQEFFCFNEFSLNITKFSK